MKDSAARHGVGTCAVCGGWPRHLATLNPCRCTAVIEPSDSAARQVNAQATPESGSTPGELQKFGGVDITRQVRGGFNELGVQFPGITWHASEAVVEAAIKPLRDEIARLRGLLRPFVEAASVPAPAPLTEQEFRKFRDGTPVWVREAAHESYKAFSAWLGQLLRFDENVPSAESLYQAVATIIIKHAALAPAPSTEPDGLLKRIEDYRAGYSCGYADGQKGSRMRDKDAAALFFGIAGVPDIAGDCDCPCEVCGIGTGKHCGNSPCDQHGGAPGIEAGSSVDELAGRTSGAPLQLGGLCEAQHKDSSGNLFLCVRMKGHTLFHKTRTGKLFAGKSNSSAGEARNG